MRERLTERLGPATAAAYRLEINLKLTRTGVALTQQNVTTRFDVIGTAEYTLGPLDGGPPVASGVVRTITGYSAPEFGDRLGLRRRAAERDAERRLAIDLADRILQRLALSAEDLGVKLAGREAARFLARPDAALRRGAALRRRRRCGWR